MSEFRVVEGVAAGARRVTTALPSGQWFWGRPADVLVRVSIAPFLAMLTQRDLLRFAGAPAL